MHAWPINKRWINISMIANDYLFKIMKKTIKYTWFLQPLLPLQHLFPMAYFLFSYRFLIFSSCKDYFQDCFEFYLKSLYWWLDFEILIDLFFCNMSSWSYGVRYFNDLLDEYWWVGFFSISVMTMIFYENNLGWVNSTFLLLRFLRF